MKLSATEQDFNIGKLLSYKVDYLTRAVTQQPDAEVTADKLNEWYVMFNDTLKDLIQFRDDMIKQIREANQND